MVFLLFIIQFVIYICVSESYHLHQVLLVLDELHGPLIRSVHQFSDLTVDQLSRRLAVRFLHNHLPLPGHIERHLSHLLTHTKLNHLVGESTTRRCKEEV